MIEDKVLNNILVKAIELYNRYRSPEAQAKLVDIKNKVVFVEFSGGHCVTCGLYDWIEDFAYVLEDLNVKAKLINVVNLGDGERRIGIFKVYPYKLKNNKHHQHPPTQ